MPFSEEKSRFVGDRVAVQDRGLSSLCGLWCAVAVVCALLLAHPFSEIGLMDDWSYFRTAEVLVRTGHLVYNGWSTSLLGWQVYLGALFIRLFGDTFTVVRLSTMFVASLTIWVFELTLEGFGLNRRNAVFGALTLGLSPLFMPLAASFMNDTDAVFPLVLCCYLCQRALRSSGNHAVLGWLVLAGVSNGVLGTVRQTAWLPGLIMLPSTVWLLRRRRDVVVTGAVLWCLVAASMLACMVWWRSVPYAVIDRVVEVWRWTGHSPLEILATIIVHALRTVVVAALISLPILCAAVPPMRRLVAKKRVAVMLAGALLASSLLIRQAYLQPWMNGVTDYIVPNWERSPLIVVGALLILCIAALAAPLFFAMVWNERPRAVDEPRVVNSPSWNEVLILCVPYLVGYAALIATRLSWLGLYDRYLLGMFPLGIACLLRLYQDRIGARLPAISYMALAAYALFAVLGTHDWYAGYRALDMAEKKLIASGVSPLQIGGPPEIDGTRQVDVAGYIDEPRIVNPKGAYFPYVDTDAIPQLCETWLTGKVTVIHPRYIVRLGHVPCSAGDFDNLTYSAWLPPFKRYVYMLHLPDARAKAP